MGSSLPSRLFWLLFPDALTASLGHRAGCRLHLLGPTAASDGESISEAARGATHVGGGLRLGATKGPPAFKLRARMSMVAGGGGWLGLEVGVGNEYLDRRDRKSVV